MARETPMWRRYATFLGRDAARDLHDEVAFHLEARTRELVDGGWAPEEAEAEARRLFGDPGAILAECRRIDRRAEQQRRMTRYVDDLKADIGYALRQLRRQPKAWCVIVLTLVVGIAASTSIFAVVDGVLLRPLPYPEADRLVALDTRNLRGEFVHLAEKSKTMRLAAYFPAPQEVTVQAGGVPLRLSAASVSAELFDVLGEQPALGRPFRVDETRENGPGIVAGDHSRNYGVVILSAGFWQRYFGGRTDAIGKTLLVDGLPCTIVGVMPAGFRFPSRGTELWLPHDIHPANPAFLWRGNVAKMIGRLRDARTVDDARAELRALAPAIRNLIPWGSAFPDDYGADYDVRPLADEIVGDTRPVLLVLLGAVGAVLMLICVNVASLLLARGVARERELATRVALGAGRRRLVRQLLAENAAVALVSGVLGTLASIGLVHALVAMLPPDLPRIDDIAVDSRVLLFALAVSVATGLGFGLLPAIRATDEGRTTPSRSARGIVGDRREGRVTGALASVELAFAVVLVASAGLLLSSLRNLTGVDPGFDPERLVSARVAPPRLAERSVAERSRLTHELLERLRAVPGVTAAGAADAIPFDDGLYGTIFDLDGDERPLADGIYTEYHGVSPGFLEAMGTKIVEGRGFGAEDGYDGPRVALVSRSLARTLRGDKSAIGARIRFNDDRQPRGGQGERLPWFTVVGVVDDVRWSSVASDRTRMVYLPIEQYWDVVSLRIVARTARPIPSIAGDLRAIVRQLDAGASVSDVRGFETRVGDSIARPRFTAYLLAAFAAVALFLASTGVYGVLSYATSRRIPEIGVRLALGANARDAFNLLFRHGLRLTLVGIGMGVPAALGVAQLLSSLLFGVDPFDATVLAVAAGVLLAVGLGVSYVPARRASLVDPMSVLRSE